MDGLVWKQDCKKEPIAYGVHKLIVGCVIEDEKISVDDLQEKIMEFEEEVQSVDIAVFNKIWANQQIYQGNQFINVVFLNFHKDKSSFSLLQFDLIYTLNLLSL